LTLQNNEGKPYLFSKKEPAKETIDFFKAHIFIGTGFV